MAHECPVCGQQCYCSGDIDDCCLNTDNAQEKCTHCNEDDSAYPDEDDPNEISQIHKHMENVQ